jgi:hypothetical protein
MNTISQQTINKLRALHNEAMELADIAEEKKINNKQEEALEYYTKAFEKEYDAALYSHFINAEGPTELILINSAANLAYNCKKYKNAEDLINIALNKCEYDEIKEELLELRNVIENEKATQRNKLENKISSFWNIEVLENTKEEIQLVNKSDILSQLYFPIKKETIGEFIEVIKKSNYEFEYVIKILNNENESIDNPLLKREKISNILARKVLRNSLITDYCRNTLLNYCSMTPETIPHNFSSLSRTEKVSAYHKPYSVFISVHASQSSQNKEITNNIVTCVAKYIKNIYNNINIYNESNLYINLLDSKNEEIINNDYDTTPQIIETNNNIKHEIIKRVCHKKRLITKNKLMIEKLSSNANIEKKEKIIVEFFIQY